MSTGCDLPRLLVIDDEPGICLAISLLLQDELQIATAQSAAEGLAYLDEPWHVILLDLRIPQVEGYELLTSVRARAPQTPVIILSALGDARTQADVMAHGAVALIEKPFSRQQLLSLIYEVLPPDLCRRK